MVANLRHTGTRHHGDERAYANNPVIIRDYLRRLGKVIRENNIKVGITNVDEKGFLLGQSPKTKVSTYFSHKSPGVCQGGKREFLTALEAVAADGYTYTPLIIGEGKMHRHSCYNNLHEHMDICFGIPRRGGQTMS